MNPPCQLSLLRRLGSHICLILSILAPTALNAAIRSSANYSVTAETMDGGGQATSSANYSSVGSLEPAAIGTSTSLSYQVQHGFITAQVVAVAVLVEGRWVFYNHSAWDNNDASANANDDSAIATDKSALLPGGTATFTNYTSYSRGLNGIMVDIAGLPGTPTASDFTFKTGNDNSPAGWATAPDPVSITVRPGAGVGGSDRVTLIWNDNNLDGTADANEAVAGQWLQVTVKATANTGLAADDVFYFGNAPGEVGNSASDAIVDTTDVLLPFNNQTAGGAATLASPYDINHDRSVDTTDVLLPFNHQTGFGTALLLLDFSAVVTSIASPPQPVPMSRQQLADLFAGGWPDSGSSSDGTTARRLTLARVGPHQLQLSLGTTNGSWQLQVTDDPTHPSWRKAEVTPQSTAQGTSWLVPITPKSSAQFFRAVGTLSSAANP